MKRIIAATTALLLAGIWVAPSIATAQPTDQTQLIKKKKAKKASYRTKRKFKRSAAFRTKRAPAGATKAPECTPGPLPGGGQKYC